MPTCTSVEQAEPGIACASPDAGSGPAPPAEAIDALATFETCGSIAPSCRVDDRVDAGGTARAFAERASGSPSLTEGTDALATFEPDSSRGSARTAERRVDGRYRAGRAGIACAFAEPGKWFTSADGGESLLLCASPPTRAHLASSSGRTRSGVSGGPRDDRLRFRQRDRGLPPLAEVVCASGNANARSGSSGRCWIVRAITVHTSATLLCVQLCLR